MVAGTPSVRAAYAIAAPKLPPDAATTPRPASAERSRLNAPLALKEPVGWRRSSFSVRRTPPRPGRSDPNSTTGVRRTY